MDERASVVSQRVLAVIGALLAVLTVSLIWIGPVASQSSPGTWTLKAPLPAPRAEVVAAVLDGKLHAVGGAVGGNAGPYHDVSDPAADPWLPRAPLPEARDHLGVAVADGKIYAFGGFAAS